MCTARQGFGKKKRERETYLIFDEGGERKKIKKVSEEPPHVGVSVFA